MLKKFLIFILFVFPSCVYHDLPVEINCDTFGLSLTADVITDATSCHIADGQISVVAQGGVEPYQFSLNGAEWQVDPHFENIPSNLYTVAVKDKNGCIALVDSIFVGAKTFQVKFDTTPDALCLDSDGTVNINVQETNGPYSFAIDNGAFTSNASFSHVSAGKHFVSIQDKDGCVVISPVTIPRGNTGTSWQNDILPIMVSSCATSGCHDGISRLDWRVYSEVKKYADVIKEKTQDRSMPFNGPLPQNKIDLIACWVDDGAPEN
ncbi:MAG: hypothetical protein ACOYXT_15305 [Bacteroidota bacterium]